MRKLLRCAGMWVLALVVLGALASCATTERREVRRLSASMHDTHLRRITSASELDQLVRYGIQLSELRDKIEIQHLCRKYRSGPERPRACDRHKSRTANTGSPAEEGEAMVLDRVEVTGSRISAADLITRNQEAGVDEGDIVKKSGDFIIVLRNGVLHSIRISRNGSPMLERVDSIKVATDESGEDTWYDEILTFGKRLILLGFNYGSDQEVAELVLFQLDADGRFSRDGRYWLRTQDYFTTNNYATRIQGDNLLMTMSLRLDLQGEMAWPEWSQRDAAQPTWKPLIDVEQLYFPIYTTPRPSVHLVLQCPIAKLGNAGLDCRTTGIIGPGRSVFYVSQESAYLAMQAWDAVAYEDPEFEEWDFEGPSERYLQTAVFRIPFAAMESPTLARVQGRVDDPLWFKQDATGLYVATQFGIEQARLALSYIPSARFMPSLDPVIAPRTVFPVREDQAMVRYSETSLWVGSHRWYFDDKAVVQSTDVLVQPLGGGAPYSLRVPHTADRIEPASGGMIIEGTRGPEPRQQPAAASWSVSFASEQSAPRLRSTLELPGHLSSEGRTHAFNLGQLSNGVRLFGMPGWPKGKVPPRIWEPEVLSDLVFMRLDAGQVRPAGVISMQDAPPSDDCQDDCYDWYGNARLFFVGDRVFGLSANLFKEARYREGAVSEIRGVELP